MGLLKEKPDYIMPKTFHRSRQYKFAKTLRKRNDRNPNFVPAIHILINYYLAPKELDFARFPTKKNADTYLVEVKAGALTFNTGT